MNKRLLRALEHHGARLKRTKKHLVYELPNGRTLVVHKTASDHHADENTIHLLRKIAVLPAGRRRQ